MTACTGDSMADRSTISLLEAPASAAPPSKASLVCGPGRYLSGSSFSDFARSSTRVVNVQMNSSRFWYRFRRRRRPAKGRKGIYLLDNIFHMFLCLEAVFFERLLALLKEIISVYPWLALQSTNVVYEGNTRHNGFLSTTLYMAAISRKSEKWARIRREILKMVWRLMYMLTIKPWKSLTFGA